MEWMPSFQMFESGGNSWTLLDSGIKVSRGHISTQPGLYPIEVAPELPHHTVSLVWNKSGYKSPACIAFLELASDWSSHMLQKNQMQ